MHAGKEVWGAESACSPNCTDKSPSVKLGNCLLCARHTFMPTATRLITRIMNTAQMYLSAKTIMSSVYHKVCNRSWR